MSEENWQHYAQTSAAEKILLSDDTINPAVWTVVKFP
jgi:hypothetical protein